MTTALAFLFGYLLGSIPFGLILTRAAAGPTCAPSAPAISAPPTCCAPATRSSPPRRLLGDMLKGTVAVLVMAYPRAPTRARRSALRAARRGPRRLPRPSLSGLARLQGRQGRRHLYRRAARAGLAGGADLLRRLARGRFASRAIPRSPRWSPARSPRPRFVSSAGRTSPLLFLHADRAAVDHAPRQYRAACSPAARARSARKATTQLLKLPVVVPLPHRRCCPARGCGGHGVA